jgi:hypothetical protein
MATNNPVAYYNVGVADWHLGAFRNSIAGAYVDAADDFEGKVGDQELDVRRRKFISRPGNDVMRTL